jgi:peptidoglycan/xylan/chitin deacetylase (PgdA/CDA1 family)
MLSENTILCGFDHQSKLASMRSSIRGMLKRVIGSFLRFLPRVQHSINNGLTVFAFHDVSDSPSEFASKFGLFVTTKTFENQIKWIKANFEIIHPSMLLMSEPLPSRAALITFDDGYLGTFENGLSTLEDMGIPSIVFLNMRTVLSKTPLLSATACYLDIYEPNFAKFCNQVGLHRPFHLTLNPRLFKEYQSYYGDIDHSLVTQFQGAFVDLDILQQWDASPFACFGNHLFEHWNAIALSPDELKSQYLDNEAALLRFANKVNMFAFTNGQPKICFDQRDVEILHSLGAEKIFSTAGGVNHNYNQLLLGRIALGELDNDSAALWFRIVRAVFQRKLFFT